MGRPPAGATDALERALLAIQRAEDADALRVAQATLLPLLGLNLEQTARAVGKDRHWTSRARNRFLRGQPPATNHGGRRHSLVREEEEAALLREAIVQAGVSPPFRVPVRQALRALLDGRSSSGSVSESTVSALLGRACSKLFPGVPVTDLQRLSGGIARMWELQEYMRQAKEAYRT
jgi:hypothetical protein